MYLQVFSSFVDVLFHISIYYQYFQSVFLFVQRLRPVLDLVTRRPVRLAASDHSDTTLGTDGWLWLVMWEAWLVFLQGSFVDIESLQNRNDMK